MEKSIFPVKVTARELVLFRGDHYVGTYLGVDLPTVVNVSDSIGNDTTDCVANGCDVCCQLQTVKPLSEIGLAYDMEHVEDSYEYDCAS